jgi:hypothetical protein
MGDAVKKRGRGRPKGSVNKNGYHTVMAIRSSLDKALNIMDKRGTPLEDILVRELTGENPAKIITAIGQFMPRQIDMQVNAEASYLDALKSVQSALNDQIDARTIDSDISATPIECDIIATDVEEIIEADEID